MENSIFERLNQELTQPATDLSNLMASIDLLYLRLEALEPGLWWDMRYDVRRISHPAVAGWLTHYGFKSTHDLTAAALVAFKSSLQNHLNELSARRIEGSLAP